MARTCLRLWENEVEAAVGREIENIGTRESNILDYAGLLSVIAESQLRTEDQAARAVNAALTLRNWIIGYHVVE